jgi:uncharacterized membrane protein YdjX (TVP38/TMEM64 family)
VFLLAIIDSGGVPLVSGVDALLVLVSVWNPSQAYLSAVAAIAGSTIGSLGLFFIAKKGGEGYLLRYTSEGRGARLRAWFQEYGLLTIFVPALLVIPMPLKICVLCAGALGVRWHRFLIVLLAARIPRYILLAWLGTRLGDQTLPYLRQHVWALLVFAVILFSGLYLIIRLLHRKRLSKSA